MTDQAARPIAPPLARPAMTPVTRAFLGGAALGLLVGIGLGFLVSANMLAKPRWTEVNTAWVRLPEQTVIGALPQTFSIPASSFDFGGVAEPLGANITDAPGFVRVDLTAKAGRVGVSLSRPDGGELVSREAVVTPQQGKTSVYLHTVPGAGPVIVLLRSIDNTTTGASAVVSKVEAAPEASLGKGQLDKINRAGVY
jgi:hypothetical protein